MKQTTPENPCIYLRVEEDLKLTEDATIDPLLNATTEYLLTHYNYTGNYELNCLFDDDLKVFAVRVINIDWDLFFKSR